MLKRIYSRTLDTFKTIELNDGFNFIISKKIDGKSNNGTGKTSLLQIINFCLCSSTENIVSYEDINGNEFSIDLEKDGQIITISRSPMRSNFVKIIDIHDILGQGILNDEEISIDKAKKLLNTYFFSKKNEAVNIPSFRLLISPFMKRGAYAFNNLYKTHAVEKNIDTQLKNSFLLDMNVKQIYVLKDIIKSRSKYLKLKEIKETDFIWNKKTIPDLKKDIDFLTSSIDILKKDLNNNIINVENQDIINDINDLNDNINTLSKRKYYLKNSIRINRGSIENNKIMSNAEIETLITEAKFLANGESVKSITEVQNFHQKLIL
ncbi:hypothetical protein GME87_13995, partial [Listeria monocytogenes]|nr:hypothetical protein [Listeria monocytogenes]